MNIMINYKYVIKKDTGLIFSLIYIFFAQKIHSSQNM